MTRNLLRRQLPSTHLLIIDLREHLYTFSSSHIPGLGHFAVIMSTPGSTRTILRSLRHLRPPTHGSKFAQKNVPSQALHRPKFVRPKDRVAYWNIVPGDIVRLRQGRVGEREGLEAEGSRRLRGEGIVTSIDREKNWLWLRDIDVSSRAACPLALRCARRKAEGILSLRYFGPLGKDKQTCTKEHQTYGAPSR